MLEYIAGLIDQWKKPAFVFWRDYISEYAQKPLDTGQACVRYLKLNYSFFVILRKVGIVNLPLHGGNAPRWLFWRMVKLGEAISEAVIDEYGTEEFITRLSDPYWFQSLACAIGFDWHSSGTTTTTCGALKQALNKENLGVYFAGGKGKTSRKTLQEIEQHENISTQKIEKLQYSSKMSAKVDSALVQDNYQLYHHSFVFNEKGQWAVIQQGMFDKYARRYHWLSDNLTSFVEEPHTAICCDKKNTALDMTAKKSKDTRNISLDLVNDNPEHLKKYMKTEQTTLVNYAYFTMSPMHDIIEMDKKNFETLRRAYEIQPRTYEELVAIKGIGPKTIRSLALLSDVIYGKKASWKDPVKYSFALGGKDKIPYEIDTKHYDETTRIMQSAINDAKLGEDEKLKAIKRLKEFYLV